MKKIKRFHKWKFGRGAYGVPCALNESIPLYYRPVYYDPLFLAILSGWDVQLLNLQGLS